MLARLKFNINDLVSQLLSYIPDDIIKNGNFFDPAIGGGQFVKEVEQKKIKLGVDTSELKTQVCGLEENVLRRDYAVNKNKLYGTYIVEKFLKYQTDKKFDVILGAPPFHDASTNLKGNLWSQFIVKANSLLKDDGYLIFITPPSWMSGTNENGNKKKKEIQEIFSKNQIVYLNLDANSYFPGIGSLFSAYVVKKTKEKNKTVVISNKIKSTLDLSNFTTLPKNLNRITLSLINKFLLYPEKNPFSAKGCVGWPKPEDQEQYKIYNTANSFASSHKEPENAKIKKVVVSVPSKLQAIYDDGKYGCSINSGWLLVKDEIEAKVYIDAINSKYIQTVFKLCKYSGFNNILLLKSFPKIINGNDKSIYDQFNLDSEEIDFIESQFN